MQSPFAYYSEQQRAHEAASAALRSRYERLAYVRLLAFVIMVVAIILLWSIDWKIGLLSALVLLPVFAYGVRIHQRIYRNMTHAEHLSALCAAELMALEHDFSFFPDGAQFLDPQHPYAADLDIFGPHSLYQYLGRCVTAAGAQRLADHLLAPSPTEIIYQRQAATAELAAHPDWQLEFRARGAELEDDPAYFRQLTAWLEEPPLVANTPLLRAARWFVPLFFVLTIIGLFTLPTWQMALFGLLPVVLVLRKFGDELGRVHLFTARAGSALTHYATLLEWLEAGRWESPLLRDIQAPFGGEVPASQAVRQLRYAISQLDVRYNAFSILLEISGLWSVQWIARLEQWKRRHKDALPAWFASLAEIDALVSLGNFRFNHPAFTDPAIDPGHRYFGSSLGHPLIPADVRVTNDLKMETDGHIHLVTGSNMAGKSTWLRTVGVNTVLALAGAPVCAAELRIPQLQVWTSMRTQDALHESTSSFFAELKRLQTIVEAVETKGSNVFFLLDEILKGTNSRDRHTGAKALIRQLIQAEGAGIIATHDLELAEMEKEAGSQVENYAMEVRIEDGELVFDYQLQRGVSKSFNATYLMAKMGIRIDEKDIKLHHD